MSEKGITVRKTHRLECGEPFLEDLISGDKTFELRYNDRAYQRGDIIELVRPNTPESFPPEISFVITYVLSGKPWLTDGYVALGLQRIDDEN